MSSNQPKNENQEAERLDESAKASGNAYLTDVESVETGHDDLETASTKRILIGSQRDDADPMLKTRDPKPREPKPRDPKALRFATLHPEKVGSVLKAVSETATTTAEVVPSNQEAELPETASIDELESVLDDSALDQMSMDSLLSGNEPTEELEIDSRIKATVTKIHNDNVFFSLKGRFEGVASLRQLKKPPVEGAMLDVVVTGYNDDDGLYEVNIPGSSITVADWSDLSEGAVVEVRISGTNTGGLECIVNNIRGFIPASQIAIARVENFNEFINQKLQCVVTEVNPRRKKLVLSHRAIMEREQQEKKKELLASITPGDTLDGVVTKLMDFGAFVDIGGVEGLVHVSKLSWDRVQHPKEVLEKGQRISVKVEKINPGSGKISLSYRDTLENPWTDIDKKYPIGADVSGFVSRIAEFGAFVKLEPGVEGLIHISELAHHRVIAVKNVVNQGDEVQVKILSVDPQAQKIGLSLKATQPKPEVKPGDKKSEEQVPADLRPSAVKKRSEPLKGGRDRSSGGEEFGLNW